MDEELTEYARGRRDEAEEWHGMKRVAISGSRDYPIGGRKLIKELVESFSPNTVILHGGAKGVDRWAGEFALEKGLQVVTFHPAWEPRGIYDPRAGHRRNMLMLTFATEVYAFWNGKSRGTLQMIEISRDAGKLKAVYRPTSSSL